MRYDHLRGEDPAEPADAVRRPATPTTWSAARAVAALVAVLLALWGPFGASASAAEAVTGPDAAAWGARWLDGQLAGGIPLVPFTSPDWGTTLEAATALAAVGGYDARLASVWTALEADREAVVNDGADDIPGRLAQAILLAHAIGEDPRSVGPAPGQDLVARLDATRTAAGADAGLYGVQVPTWDGAYRQGLSLVALVAAGEAPDPSAVQWLVDQQCDDGSWMPYRSDLGAPCAFDPVMFVGPETNATAWAISGLLAAGGPGAVISDALAWLDATQAADGGWGFYAGDAPDPNSTAVVIRALRAAGLLDAPEFTDRDGTALASLLTHQLGCAEGVDAGSFTFPNTGGAPNAMATVQAVPAAAEAPPAFVGATMSTPGEDVCPEPAGPGAPSGDPDPAAPGSVSPRTGDAGARPAQLALTGVEGDRVILGAGLVVAGLLMLGARRLRGD